jgi:hypothetical protein
MRLTWKLIIFFASLIFIYLLFPILIVPSTLPAINQSGPADVTIFELKTPAAPTLADRWQDLRRRHRQGLMILFGRRN